MPSDVLEILDDVRMDSEIVHRILRLFGGAPKAADASELGAIPAGAPRLCHDEGVRQCMRDMHIQPRTRKMGGWCGPPPGSMLT